MGALWWGVIGNDLSFDNWFKPYFPGSGVERSGSSESIHVVD
jgi:hypothetical protein